jgi:hypothetical protein
VSEVVQFSMSVDNDLAQEPDLYSFSDGEPVVAA